MAQGRAQHLVFVTTGARAGADQGRFEVSRANEAPPPAPSPSARTSRPGPTTQACSWPGAATASGTAARTSAVGAGGPR